MRLMKMFSFSVDSAKVDVSAPLAVRQPSLIEPEDDRPPVQRLSSGKTVLQPGLNEAKVSAKVRVPKMHSIKESIDQTAMSSLEVGNSASSVSVKRIRAFHICSGRAY